MLATAKRIAIAVYMIRISLWICTTNLTKKYYIKKIKQESIMDNLLKYSIQLAMLTSLFDGNLITEDEYIRIKAELRRVCKIKEKYVDNL